MPEFPLRVRNAKGEPYQRIPTASGETRQCVTPSDGTVSQNRRICMRDAASRISRIGLRDPVAFSPVRIAPVARNVLHSRGGDDNENDVHTGGLLLRLAPMTRASDLRISNDTSVTIFSYPAAVLLRLHRSIILASRGRFNTSWRAQTSPLLANFTDYDPIPSRQRLCIYDERKLTSLCTYDEKKLKSVYNDFQKRFEDFI